MPQYLDLGPDHFKCLSSLCSLSAVNPCDVCNDGYCANHLEHPHVGTVQSLSATPTTISNAHAIPINQSESAKEPALLVDGALRMPDGNTPQRPPQPSQPAQALPLGRSMEFFNSLGNVLTLGAGDAENLLQFKAGLTTAQQAAMLSLLQTFAAASLPGTDASALPPGNASERPKRIACTDAGFGGVAMVVALAEMGILCIAHIKQAHALFPKDWLKENLSDAPGGSTMALETTINGRVFLAIGYKYSSKKTLFFVAPAEAGGLSAGLPYMSRFANDSHGNQAARPVPRPLTVSRYFDSNGVIDTHNHIRQYVMALEKKWIVDCGFFRIWTTVLAMTAVDTFLALRSEAHAQHALRKENFGISAFVEILANELVDNQRNGELSRPNARYSSSVYGSSGASSREENADFTIGTHVLMKIGPSKNQNGEVVIRRTAGGHVVPRQLRCSHCSVKTTTFCSGLHCNSAAVCRGKPEDPLEHDSTSCLAKHIAKMENLTRSSVPLRLPVWPSLASSVLPPTSADAVPSLTSVSTSTLPQSQASPRLRKRKKASRRLSKRKK